MTRSVDDYLGLITPFWRGKPNFVATVAMLVAPFADLQVFLRELPAQFDLDTAIGAQLDVDGQWIGRSRKIPVPIQNVYFSFDMAGLGFDQAVWQGPYSPASEVNSLDDDTYRSLLRAKIAANNTDGTTPTIVKIYEAFFGAFPGTLIYVEDRQDMTFVVGVVGQIPNLLYLALLTGGFLPLKPEGVEVFYAVTTVNETPNFGFDVENQYISGFDIGSWADLTIS